MTERTDEGLLQALPIMIRVLRELSEREEISPVLRDVMAVSRQVHEHSLERLNAFLGEKQ